MTGDPYDLERFVLAQDNDGMYHTALGELRRGRKTTHWMWFTFPQLVGLGRSAMSRKFAIASLDEARAYLHHSVLGPRLVECARAVVESISPTAEQVFGAVDTQKLQSSMTLFMRASTDESLFGHVLDRYFDGEPDSTTDRLLDPE